MYENELPALFNNPRSIHTALSPQKIDALEFEIAQIGHIDFNISDLKMTMNLFVGMIFEMLNKNRIYEAIKQWLWH